MQLILLATAALLVPTLVLALLMYLGLWLFRRRPAGFWRRTIYVHLVLAPLHAFLVIPGALGFLAPRFVDTRPDERAYAGPRFDAGGGWLIQTRRSLAAENGGAEEDPPDQPPGDPSSEFAVSFSSADGTQLQAYVVPAARRPPRATVVMVHGLFRNAMELEVVGDMFRRQGAEVCLLELRNHGGSGDGGFTFGLRESEDVEAAVRYLRARPGRANDPLILFGVSLGTAAVALAAPRVPNLAGVVLDAPMDDLLSTAHRMLSETRGRVPYFPEPFRSLIIRNIELFSGFRMAEVRPIEALASLPADLPVLLIGAGQDERMPPVTVAAVYSALRSPPGVKELWICDPARHGHVWDEDPREYERRLVGFLERAVDR